MTNLIIAYAGLRVELNGMVYTNNNTMLLLDSIGEGDDNALFCRTDLRPCCYGSSGIGEWFYPNGSMVPIRKVGHSFYRNRRDEGRVFLRRRRNALSPLGTYCCKVPTGSSAGKKIETFCVFLSKSVQYTSSTIYNY